MLVVVVISLTQYFTVPASSCIVLKSPFFFLSPNELALLELI